MMRGFGYGVGPGIGYGHPFAGLFSALVFLIALAAIVALVVMFVRRSGIAGAIGHPCHPATGHYADGERALSVAMNRFANGEITREQYEEIRDTLKGIAPPPPSS